jgi:hypothetical protein
VHGEPIVEDGMLVSGRLEEMLGAHATLSRKIQKLDR